MQTVRETASSLLVGHGKLVLLLGSFSVSALHSSGLCYGCPVVWQEVFQGMMGAKQGDIAHTRCSFSSSLPSLVLISALLLHLSNKLSSTFAPEFKTGKSVGKPPAYTGYQICKDVPASQMALMWQNCLENYTLPTKERHFSPLFWSLINIEKRTAYWRRPNLTECQLLYELPNNIMQLKNVTISEGKLPGVLCVWCCDIFEEQTTHSSCLFYLVKYPQYRWFALEKRGEGKEWSVSLWNFLHRFTLKTQVWNPAWVKVYDVSLALHPRNSEQRNSYFHTPHPILSLRQSCGADLVEIQWTYRSVEVWTWVGHPNHYRKENPGGKWWQ